MSKEKALFKCNMSSPTVCGCKFHDFKFETSDPSEIARLREKIVMSVDSVQVVEVPQAETAAADHTNHDDESDRIIKSINESVSLEALNDLVNGFIADYPSSDAFTETQREAIELTLDKKREQFSNEHKGKNKGKHKGA